MEFSGAIRKIRKGLNAIIALRKKDNITIIEERISAEEYIDWTEWTVK